MYTEDLFYANDPPCKASDCVHFCAVWAILILLMQKHKCPHGRESAGGSWTEFISRADSLIWVQMLSTCKLLFAFFPPTCYTYIFSGSLPSTFQEEEHIREVTFNRTPKLQHADEETEAPSDSQTSTGHPAGSCQMNRLSGFSGHSLLVFRKSLQISN